MKLKTKEPGGAAGSVIIREMELQDMQPVYELGNRLFTAERWPVLYRCWDEHELLDLFGADDAFSLVAEAGGRIVGFCLGNITRKPRSAWCYGYLLWLGVATGFKKRGVGRRMLNRLTDWFVEKGARMMLVDTSAENRRAIEFFKRAGFGSMTQHVYLSRNLDSHPRYIERKAGEWDE